MEVIDLFAQKFNVLLELGRDKGLNMGNSLERLPSAEMFQGIQLYLRGYSFDGVSGFQWFSPWREANIHIPGNLLWLASYPNVNLDYVLDIITGEVTTFDPEHYSVEWACAVNYQAFFQSLLIILDNEIEKAQKQTFDLDESILMARYEECMKINRFDEKFSSFYEHVLGLELDN